MNIHLEKNIPHQAGLGGGSSNAATTLWALNLLLGKPVSHDDLITWSGELGSDITFFLSQGTALCTGRGEILEPLDPLPPSSLWILKPAQGLSTPEVFRQLNLQQLMPVNPQHVISQLYQGQPAYHNDLQNPAFLALPLLQDLATTLRLQGYESITLSGSGSALYCFGGSRPPSIPKTQSYAARFINRLADSWYS